MTNKIPPMTPEEIATLVDILERNAAQSNPLTLTENLIKQWLARGVPVRDLLDRGVVKRAIYDEVEPKESDKPKARPKWAPLDLADKLLMEQVLSVPRLEEVEMSDWVRYER